MVDKALPVPVNGAGCMIAQAYGIYIDGQCFVICESKDAANAALRNVQKSFMVRILKTCSIVEHSYHGNRYQHKSCKVA